MNYNRKALTKQTNAVIRGIADLLDIFEDVNSAIGDGDGNTYTDEDGNTVVLAYEEIEGRPALKITITNEDEESLTYIQAITAVKKR